MEKTLQEQLQEKFENSPLDIWELAKVFMWDEYLVDEINERIDWYWDWLCVELIQEIEEVEKRIEKSKEQFFFTDDEWSKMFIKWVDYETFRKHFDSLTEEINSLWEDFNFFYEELEKRLTRNTGNTVVISWIWLSHFNY